MNRKEKDLHLEIHKRKFVVPTCRIMKAENVAMLLAGSENSPVADVTSAAPTLIGNVNTTSKAWTIDSHFGTQGNDNATGGGFRGDF